MDLLFEAETNTQLPLLIKLIISKDVSQICDTQSNQDVIIKLRFFLDIEDHGSVYRLDTQKTLSWLSTKVIKSIH